MKETMKETEQGRSQQRLQKNSNTMTSNLQTKLREVIVRYRPHVAKPAILVWSGLTSLFAILCVADCSFMIAARYNSDSARVGLFSQAMYDVNGHKLGCLSYDQNYTQLDGIFRAGRAFGVITAMLTGTAFLSIAVSLLACPKPKNKKRRLLSSQNLWSSAKYTLMASTLTQMFVFFALGSHTMCTIDKCHLIGVGVLAAFNVIFLAMVSIAIYFEPAPTLSWLRMWDEHRDRPNTATNNNAAANSTPSPALHGVDPQVADYILAQQQQQQQHRNSLRMDEELPAPPVVMEEGGGAYVVVGPEGNMIPLYHHQQHHHQQQQQQPQLRNPQYYNPQVPSEERPSPVYGLQDLISFRCILCFLLFFAWAVSIAGVQRCSFLLYGPTGGDMSSFSGIGLFTRAIYSDGIILGCLEYPFRIKKEFDPVFVTSRIFGALTALFMTIVLLLFILLFFVDKYKEETWFMVRLLLPSATLCQLFAFFVYRTQTCIANEEFECIPGQLGVWVILNVILMTTLTVLVLVMPPPPHPLFVWCHHDGEECLEHQQEPQQQQPQQQQQQPNNNPNPNSIPKFHHPSRNQDATSVAPQHHPQQSSKHRILQPPLQFTNAKAGNNIRNLVEPKSLKPLAISPHKTYNNVLSNSRVPMADVSLAEETAALSATGFSDGDDGGRGGASNHSYDSHPNHHLEERIVRIDRLQGGSFEQQQQQQQQQSVSSSLGDPHPQRRYNSNSINSAAEEQDAEEFLPPAEFMTIQVEYNGREKRIIKTVTHSDGSKTITTTVEELGSAGEIDKEGDNHTVRRMRNDKKQNSRSHKHGNNNNNNNNDVSTSSDSDRDDGGDNEKGVNRGVSRRYRRRDPRGFTTSTRHRSYDSNDSEDSYGDGEEEEGGGEDDDQEGVSARNNDSEHSVKEIIVRTHSGDSGDNGGSDTDADCTLTVLTVDQSFTDKEDCHSETVGTSTF